MMTAEGKPPAPPRPSRGLLLKPMVFLLCLVPAGLLAWKIVSGTLSANPIDDITDATGTWTLRFVMITLAVTPLRRITGWKFPGKVRREIFQVSAGSFPVDLCWL